MAALALGDTFVMHRMTALASLSLLLAATLAPGAAAQQTQVLTVTTTSDGADAAPSDGLCETARGNRVCTLRAAIQEADARPVPATIQLGEGAYVLALQGAGESNLQVRRGRLVIRGAGAARTIIDGGQIDRVLAVYSPGSLEISGVTIRNGRARGGQSGPQGGGIANEGTLTLIGVVVSGNAATFGGGIGNNGGTLTLRDTQVIDNTASTGGGLINNGKATVAASTFARNRATGGGSGSTGGGIDNRHTGVIEIADSTLLENTAENSGGGMSSTGTATLVGSTVAYNRATNTGGGLSNNNGTLSVTNSTISGNASRVAGGLQTQGGTPASLYSVTVYNNGDLGISAAGPLTIANSIVADSTSVRNCAGRAQITSLGHNLESGSLCGFTQPTDPVDTDPLLGPLGDNGGPTLTHALLADSPAIDRGTAAGNGQEACPARDQRGSARPIDGDGDGDARCDIGAFEAPIGTSPRPATPAREPATDDQVFEPHTEAQEMIEPTSEETVESPPEE